MNASRRSRSRDSKISGRKRRSRGKMARESHEKEAEKKTGEPVNGQKKASSGGRPRSTQIAHFPVSKIVVPAVPFPGGGSEELSVASLPHLPSSVSHDRACRSVDNVHHVHLEGHLLVRQVRSVAQKVGVLPFHLPFASFE